MPCFREQTLRVEKLFSQQVPGPPLGLGTGQARMVDVKGTPTSSRKEECSCLHALKKLTHDC